MGNRNSRRLFLEPGLSELQGPDKDGDMYRPATFGITPIWYRYDLTAHSWKWTPEWSKNIWMDVSTLTVSSGIWQGEQPTPENVRIIESLRVHNPKPMIEYVENSATFIDRGTFGRVHKYSVQPRSQGIARHFNVVHPDKCAVKHLTIDASQILEFAKEVKYLTSATKIYHENIVFYWGATYAPPVGDAQCNVNLVMEYCDGNLRTLFRQQTTAMSHNRLHVLITDILNALDFLHVLDIVHRDLKPENILFCIVDGAPRFKVCDFGFARSEMSLYRTLNCAFTPGYAPPELFQTGAVTNKGDVFALGVIIYEACSPNVKPWQNCSDNFQMNLSHEPLSPGPHISRAARCLIDECLRMSVQERPSIETVKANYLARFDNIHP